MIKFVYDLQHDELVGLYGDVVQDALRGGKYARAYLNKLYFRGSHVNSLKDIGLISFVFCV